MAESGEHAVENVFDFFGVGGFVLEEFLEEADLAPLGAIGDASEDLEHDVADVRFVFFGMRVSGLGRVAEEDFGR